MLVTVELSLFDYKACNKNSIHKCGFFHNFKKKNISSEVKLPKFRHNMQMEYNVFTRENSSINGISYVIRDWL